jgi:hypothetical protein
MSSSAGGPHYQIIFSSDLPKVLRRLLQKADREEREEAFLNAFLQAVKNLQERPFDFGEPLYRLPVLRMQVRQAVIRPLGFNFAVHEEMPFVYLKGVKMLAKY